MRTAVLAASLLTLLTGPTSASAQAAAASSPEERRRFVSIVQNLERAPRTSKLRNDRAWAIAWLTDTPDVSVTVCSDVVGGVPARSDTPAAEALVQYTLAMAAFLIDHPDRTDDHDAQQLAGLRSALSVYRLLATSSGHVRSPGLERLLRLEARGGLQRFVHEAYRRCSAKVSGSISPGPPSWEKVWDEPGVAVMYVDRSSVSRSGDLRSITTRTVYRAPLPQGHVAERIRVEEFDCPQRRSRIRRVTIVANDGGFPETIDWDAGRSEWQSHGNGTLGAAKADLACAPG